MYTVLIAEDELLVRIGIAGSVRWADTKMRVVGEAEDGLAAWKLYQKFRPDIVITDIRMPGMDGIELLRKIRAADSQCAVIMVTNVEHSDTVREAKSLGVTDFLLKATMRQDDIRNAVLRACETLPRVSGEAGEKDDLSCWQRVLTAPSDPEPDTVPPFPIQALLFMHIQRDERLTHRVRTSLIDLVTHEISAFGVSSPIWSDDGALFIYREAWTDHRSFMNILVDLQNYIEDIFRIHVAFVAVPSPVTVMQLRLLNSTVSRITRYPEYCRNQVLVTDSSGFVYDERLREIHRLFDRTAFPARQDAQYVRLHGLFTRFPGELSDGWLSVKKRGCAILETLNGPEEPENLRTLLRCVCDALQQYLQQILQSVRPEVLTLMDYIDKHLGEEISAAHLAGLLNYQQKYFSTFFKREFGCNFVDYVTEVRIQKAGDLLDNSRLTVSEIGELCGFSRVSYFDQKFREMTGMTPKQWRDRR